MGSCNRIERRVCTKEEVSVFTIERGKRGGASICRRSAAKRIYSTIKITTDLTSPFCSKERRMVQDYCHLN